jgi:agmatinase
MDSAEQVFVGCDVAYGEASTVLFGAPFETGKPRRTGANSAPSAVRKGSAKIETFSPYLHADLRDLKIHDAGDLALAGFSTAAILDTIESFCGKVHDNEKMPVMIGGEHIVTFGAVRAAASRWPNLAVMRFGAHANLLKEFRGEFFSHRTIMRRVWDLVGNGRIFQFGVRSGSREEFTWAAERVRMEVESANSVDSRAEAVLSSQVYITVDLDVLDPAEFPGTGMPEAGGMSYRALHDALLSLRGLDVVGFDICGLSPRYDRSGASTALACKLIREMLIIFS